MLDWCLNYRSEKANLLNVMHSSMAWDFFAFKESKETLLLLFENLVLYSLRNIFIEALEAQIQFQLFTDQTSACKGARLIEVAIT